MKKMVEKNIKHAFSIIYPLGDKVYNIAVTSPMLISSMDRFTFEDYQETLIKLILNHNEIIKDNDLNPK